MREVVTSSSGVGTLVELKDPGILFWKVGPCEFIFGICNLEVR